MYNWLAQRYATKSNVIFESFNEMSTTTDSDAQAFADYNNGWISAIESGEGANSHLKIIQFLLDGSEFNYLLEAPFINGNHNNVMLATHSYGFVDSQYSSYMDLFASKWASAAHNQNIPWIDTEFSSAMNQIQINPPPRNVGLTQATDMFAKYNAAGFLL